MAKPSPTIAMAMIAGSDLANFGSTLVNAVSSLSTADCPAKIQFLVKIAAPAGPVLTVRLLPVPRVRIAWRERGFHEGTDKMAGRARLRRRARLRPCGGDGRGARGRRPQHGGETHGDAASRAWWLHRLRRGDDSGERPRA